ncbi:hypothetical protein CH249_14140 [Rhodococcus sp. 05-2255-3B1]|uniref:hypothetical protein n=1 Tax=unclassified Rhodococcus (in: high G+C Gram-positive bacteria) TaxID=192944 RepID=UPI000B9B9C78|nr:MULTISPECIES: hypothetical protein [unclassified Rhodococcus (in: high G+C Gram-positive bacteria)]OZE10218.1 hypothetical protein CH249_14140 [Rhodococcus sp. 05-2255-3B1]OZE13612.1 hypothetical protein CH250_06995 [Rhodococcus sp. 05-2255-3C]OZE13699.1 hypothetical protein CH255_23800 [Rhodococcus sp. 05-2255-2A2]
MPAQTFRKKPVEIEAMHFRSDLTPGEAHEIYSWVERNTLGSFDVNEFLDNASDDADSPRYPESGVSIDAKDGRMVIATLEGLHWVNLDDWVIRGIKGEFYPCKPDIFASSYDPVSSVDL